MNDRAQIEQVAHAIAAAIAAKDDRALMLHLAPDFVLRRPGAAAIAAPAFAAGVREQPVEVVSVTIEQLEIDLEGDTAVASGIQSSRVRSDGETVDDRQPFVDWFVKVEGRWQVRLALDFSDW